MLEKFEKFEFQNSEKIFGGCTSDPEGGVEKVVRYPEEID
jgi:hypothetical protein